MRRLAVGLIGAGKHGQRYAHHIRADVPELALAALCRRDAARGREQARTLGCRFHDEWAALVADPAVEAVIAVVPPTLHPAVAAAVAVGRQPLPVENRPARRHSVKHKKTRSIVSTRMQNTRQRWMNKQAAYDRVD